MKAPPALEPALRAVLGEQLDAVIVESPYFALRAVEILKEHESGRLSFISAGIGAGAATHEVISAPGSRDGCSRWSKSNPALRRWPKLCWAM